MVVGCLSHKTIKSVHWDVEILAENYLLGSCFFLNWQISHDTTYSVEDLSQSASLKSYEIISNTMSHIFTFNRDARRIKICNFFLTVYFLLEHIACLVYEIRNLLFQMQQWCLNYNKQSLNYIACMSSNMTGHIKKIRVTNFNSTRRKKYRLKKCLLLHIFILV